LSLGSCLSSKLQCCSRLALRGIPRSRFNLLSSVPAFTLKRGQGREEQILPWHHSTRPPNLRMIDTATWIYLPQAFLHDSVRQGLAQTLPLIKGGRQNSKRLQKQVPIPYCSKPFTKTSSIVFIPWAAQDIGHSFAMLDQAFRRPGNYNFIKLHVQVSARRFG